MEFIKILFNIAFTVLPLLLLLLLQIPAARTENNNNNNKFQNAETSTTTTTTTTIATTTTAIQQNSQTATTTTAAKTLTSTSTATVTTATTLNKNKNNTTTRELRKHEQIIDNSIDFTVDPCDDFYQYACGEWKHQLYDDNNEEDAEFDAVTFAQNTTADDDVDNNNNNRNNNNNNNNNNNHNHKNNHNDGDGDFQSDKYDRTLAMIDYLTDKEVLKYFNMKNMTKNFNTTIKTQTKTTTKTTTTKEPDFIIKVYKYYKSCIAIQQYEPIKYLEWLELNEHVKWPSLINTTTTAAAANSKEHNNDHKHHHHHYQHQHQHHEHEQHPHHNEQHAANTAAERQEDDTTIEDDEEEAGESDNAYHQDTTSSEDYTTEWFNTLAILRKYGMNGIFIEEIIYNTKTLPPKLLLGFNKPLKEGGFKSLKSEQLKLIFNNLNLDLTPEDFKKVWLKITKFEWQLTKLNDVGDDLGSNLITLEHLPVDWLQDYLQVLFNQPTPLDLNMRIVVTNVAYFITLDELLKEYDNDFLNQYLQIRFLWHLYQQEPQQFQPLSCIYHIKQFMPLAFEWIFEKQHESLKTEIPKIYNLYSNIRKQFNFTLYNNKNNFQTPVLEKLVTKLESIQLKVGTFVDINASEFFYDNRKFYQTLKFSTRRYYSNHMKMLKFNFDALHFNLRSINTNSLYYDMQEYQQGLSSAPYYNQRLNTLHLPLSLLQPPLYHQDFTDIYKYSSIGFLLAQTLMYGFNMKQLPANDHSKLLLHNKCLSSLDPFTTSDKIADVGGLHLSYHSFFLAQINNNNLISNRKKFFLNFAQTFCGIPTLEEDMGRNSVNYALAQFAEFAKTFECSPDSHMNPHEKCYLWD